MAYLLLFGHQNLKSSLFKELLGARFKILSAESPRLASLSLFLVLILLVEGALEKTLLTVLVIPPKLG